MQVPEVSAPGIIPYGLAGNFCEECGQAKMSRLFEVLTGCKTCDEVITRHRCTGRPDIGSLADGQAWECPDCGSRWAPRTVQEACADCCGDCGHTVTVRRWDSEEGPRTDTAPRYSPAPWTPFRNALRDSVAAILAPPARASHPGSCYRTASGAQVHVKPGCRCQR